MPTALFRRPSAVQCFFCQSNLTPAPRNRQAFRCPHCNCVNRYDSNGEILSDEPAMHDEALNSKSFARRASPSKDRLPTMYGKGPFCHTCQTNQMLLINLLSNYLPSPSNPEYARRLELLPEYRDSLHLRYPPVCESCLPMVEDEIRQKNIMARAKALGGWLQESKGKEKQRRVSGGTPKKEKRGARLLAWKIRGSLWIITLLIALVGDSMGAFGYEPPRQLNLIQPVLPAVAFISLLWTVWDPTYSSYLSARLQGRDVRITGKRQYIILQMLSWSSRLLSAALLSLFWFRPDLDYLHLSQPPPSSRSRLYFSVSLTLEISTFLTSCMVLRLRQPPTIRLIDTQTHKFPATSRQSTPKPTSARASPVPTTAEPDLLASLTLSSRPVISTPNPVFGMTSLLSSASQSNTRPPEDTESSDPDAMDWTPTDPNAVLPSAKSNPAITEPGDSAWLRPQRFFAPERPTGLEGLFERTTLGDSDHQANASSAKLVREPSIWWGVCAIVFMPLLGIMYLTWSRRIADAF